MTTFLSPETFGVLAFAAVALAFFAGYLYGTAGLPGGRKQR